MKKNIVNNNGVTEEVTVIGSFELENKNEYLIYTYDDEEIHVSKITRKNNEIVLENIPEEDNELVSETIDSILEGI